MAVLVPFTLLGFWIFVYVASSTFLQTTIEDLLIVHLAVWRVRGRGGGTPLWRSLSRDGWQDYWLTGAPPCLLTCPEYQHCSRWNYRCSTFYTIGLPWGQWHWRKWCREKRGQRIMTITWSYLSRSQSSLQWHQVAWVRHRSKDQSAGARQYY